MSAGVRGAPRVGTAVTANEIVGHFATIKPVKVADRGPRCATMWVGGVIEYIGCFDIPHLPSEVYSDSVSGLILIAVDSGDTLAFPDHSVRVLTTSQHYVSVQQTDETAPGVVRFSVTSASGIRWCYQDRIGDMHCR
jgi:hypothetical protein